MNLKFLYAKQLYLLKQKIDHLSERDRVLLLFLITVALFFVWYFALINPEIKTGNDTKLRLQKKLDEINSFTDKKRTLEILINTPDTARKIQYFRGMIAEIAKLDQKLSHYNEHYITGRDLAALLHDMLKQTMGVTIQNFGTVNIPVAPQNQQANTADQSPPDQSSNSPGAPVAPHPGNQTSVKITPLSLNLQTTHYRLVIRGTYFPVMNYLQHLEQLPWQLYWDKFDYTVAKYPEGIASIDFYTLKPQSTQLNTNQGSSP